MLEDLGYFHFLRPGWLLVAPALWVFERLLRRNMQGVDRFAEIIEPELLRHLKVEKSASALFNPRLALGLLVVLATDLSASFFTF